MTSARKTNSLAHEFGPWSQFVGNQSIDHQIPANPQLQVIDNETLKLPRVIARSNRTRNLNNFPVKIQKLQLKDYGMVPTFIPKRNNKTISYDPHLSSFYHKKYPKSSRKEISLRYDADLLNQGKRIASIQLGSTIEVLSEQLENNARQQKKKSCSNQKQFARKRSLIQLIKYLKIMEEGAPIFKKPPQKKNLNHHQIAQISSVFKSREYSSNHVSPALIKKN